MPSRPGRNPHMHLVREGAEPWAWRCIPCGAQVCVVDHGDGSCSFPRDCAFDYPPCEHCGETPECAPDCRGVLAALGGGSVYVAGLEA